ncbi:hypothetical protein J2Z65_000515 [Paenibacillus aceris]|uniref:Uncharacterized protein n=1 Tax=Paenibacillus aceris TaxID=869555 RepID=A0ABS4HRS6_9BACL|nr:hypothetical protein [Paenibacillus aceris]
MQRWLSDQTNANIVEGDGKIDHYLITPTPSSFISTRTRNSNSG